MDSIFLVVITTFIIALIFVGAYSDMTFMAIVIINTVIGIKNRSSVDLIDRDFMIGYQSSGVRG